MTLNLLALQQRNPQFNPFFFWWSFPFGIFLILGMVAGAGVTAVFLFWDQRRRKKNYSLEPNKVL